MLSSVNAYTVCYFLQRIISQIVRQRKIESTMRQTWKKSTGFYNWYFNDDAKFSIEVSSIKWW
jgi:hypothetical protein